MNNQEIMQNTMNAFIVVEKFYTELSGAFKYIIAELSKQNLEFYSPGGDAVFCTISKSINRPDSWFMRYPSIYFVETGSADPTNETLPEKAVGVALYADESYFPTPIFLLSVYHSFVYNENATIESFRSHALWAFWGDVGPSSEDTSIKTWKSLGEITRKQLGRFTAEVFSQPLDEISSTADLDQKVISVLYRKYEEI